MNAGRLRGLGLVFLAGALYSSSGVFTHLLHFDAWTIQAWRSVSGGLFTVLWIFIDLGRRAPRAFMLGQAEMIMVPLGAIGGIAFIFALKLATITEVMVVYATMPFVTAALAWLWGRERPTRRLMVASGIALLGVVVMLGGIGSRNSLLGVALTLLMNLSFGLTLVTARRSPNASMAVYALATLLAAGIGFCFAPQISIGVADLGLLLLFGILTGGLAMGLYIVGARFVPPAEVGLVGIVDVAIGPALVWLCFGENPGLLAVTGAAIVIGALGWHSWPDLRAAIGAGRIDAAPAPDSTMPDCCQPVLPCN